MIRGILAVLAALVLAAAAQAADPATAPVNGSFEQGAAGWTLSGPAVAISTSAVHGATDGVQLVELNVADQPGGSISQRVATTPGMPYRLRFDVGAFSRTARGEQRLRVRVESAAGETVSETYAIWPPSGRWTGRVRDALAGFDLPPGCRYSTRTLEFVAAGDTAVLTFEDVSKVTPGVDLLLDHVRFEADARAPLTRWVEERASRAVFVLAPLSLVLALVVLWGAVRARRAR
jgi:uncharacterized lipoprotein YbaY